MADETKIIKDVMTAVDGLAGSFSALSGIIENNLTQQKALIRFISEIKKTIGSSKELKDFSIAIQGINKAQTELTKIQKFAADVAKKEEKIKQQAIKTSVAAQRAMEAEAIAQEKLKQAKNNTEKSEISLQRAKANAEKTSLQAIGAYKQESDRLRQLTEQAKNAAVQHGVNSKQAKALRTEQQALDKKIKDVDASLGIHNRNVGNYGGVLSGAKGILGQFGLAIGGAQIAMKLFNGIIEKSQGAGDSWAKSVAGWGGALDAFYKTFTSGEWGDLFENMLRAYNGMKDVAGIKDDLFEGGLGARVFEVETQILIQEQENIRKASKQGSDERIAAAKEIIRLNELILERKEDEIDANIELNDKTVERLTKLNSDELYKYIQNFREETKLRKETLEYLEKEKQLKSTIASGKDKTVKISSGMYPTNSIIEATAEEKEAAAKAQEELTALYKDENTKRYIDYAATIDKYKITDDKMVKNFINAHIAKKELRLEMMRATARAEQDLIRDSEKENIDKIETVFEKESAVEKIKIKVVDVEKSLSDNLTQHKIDNLDKLEEKNLEVIENIDEANKKSAELDREISDKKVELFTSAGNAFFEVEIEKYDKAIEANRKFYDDLLSNQLLDEEQRSLLEAQREAKENELEAKKRETEKRQFLFNQAVKVAEIWMEAAKGIAVAKALGPATAGASLFWIPKIKISAALQTGIVLAQSIPNFDKGTENTPDTYIAGEKRSEIRIDKKGNVSVVTEPTLFTNDKGSKIISGARTQTILDDIANFTNQQVIFGSIKSNKENRIVAGLVSELLKENKSGNDRIVKAITKKQTYSGMSEINRMRKEDLRNKLKG